jgi:ATP-binding cassette subfamily C (CFTR/MRP) protein 1
MQVCNILYLLGRNNSPSFLNHDIIIYTSLTSSVNLLPYADLVVALGTDGKVAEQGSFVDLNAKDGYVKSFCIEHVSKGVTNSASDFSDELKVDVKLLRGTPEKTPAAIKALEQSRQTGDMSVYKYYFDATGGLYATPFFFFAACWGFFSTFPSKSILSYFGLDLNVC